MVRDRQGEALRISVGLTIMDDTVEVFVLDKKLGNTEDIAMNLEMINELGLKMYTNTEENVGIEYIPTEKLAKKFLEYDTVLPY